MKHLINEALKYEKFQDDWIPENDGVECLTDFSSYEFRCGKVVSAHLPFCTDWYGIWSGKRPYLKEYGAFQNYLSYGRSREEMIQNISDAMKVASELHPKYAVLHAGSANVDELFDTEYSETNEEVLLAFCDMLNAVRERIGRMPVKLMFENQWWPGLTFLDAKEFEILENNLEFDDWGYCLDTGHLLISLKHASDDASNVKLLKEAISKIPDDVVERIKVMHLHTNHSGEYYRNYDRVGSDGVRPLKERIIEGYQYVIGLDRHLPFTVPECTEVVEMVSPDYLVHEMGAVDPDEKISDYKIQRSLF